MLPTKSQVISALIAAVERDLETAERAQAIAASEATSEESKAEGKYDTRATEASYLARGQAERVAELQDLLIWFKRLAPGHRPPTVSLGSLVSIQGDREQVLFISPVGGGKATVDGVEVKTISLASPLGQVMMGLEEGDDLELRTPDGTQDLEIDKLA